MTISEEKEKNRRAALELVAKRASGLANDPGFYKVVFGTVAEHHLLNLRIALNELYSPYFVLEENKGKMGDA